jgi:hypothetical protein
MSVLDPTRRTAFTDALRPPPGYVLDAGVGTTYSLDFEAFTAVVLAFAGADLDDARPDPASVLTAVARLQHRLRVFVNAGGFLEPRAPDRLFALYDRIVRSVQLDGAAFHPKVWALKFMPQERPELRKAPPVYRVLCASRNVTAAPSWELAARFEGRPGKRSELGEDVAKFCRKLAKRGDAPPAVWKLVSTLETVEFEVGKESAQALRLRWQWPGESKLSRHLPARAERALLISPFVRAEFLKTLAARVEALTVVSTQDELDALSDETHAELARASIFVVNGMSTDDVPGFGLHAKLLAWEEGGTGVRETLVGSANATGAAWGLSAHTNCEAMVALRPGLRIDDALSSFVWKEKGVLQAWIDRYERGHPEVDETDQARRVLEQLQRSLMGLALEGSHDPAARRLVIVGAGSPPPAISKPPAGVEIDIAPLVRARDDASWAPLANAFEAPGAVFEHVGRADLCAFALVRIRDTAHEVPARCFGLQFKLQLDDADALARDEALHAKLLENADPHALLLNLLQGLPVGSAPRNDGARAGGSAQALLQLATVERVLEVCTADRSRVEEVDALLSAYRDSERMRSFTSFWSAFKAALKEDRRV